jgi:hypothetical protein
MAKKKARAVQSTPPDDRVVIIHLKGSAAYAQWLDDVHRKTHIPRTTIIRLAVADWAKKHNLPAPPEI